MIVNNSEKVLITSGLKQTKGNVLMKSTHIFDAYSLSVLSIEQLCYTK